jgi:hypothetical protein
MLRLPEFEYHRPETVEEAVRLLAELGETAMAVAGGTDVIPNLKHRLHEPRHLVSLRRIQELRGVALQDDELVIGAGETLAAVAGDPWSAARAGAGGRGRAGGGPAAEGGRDPGGQPLPRHPLHLLQPELLLASFRWGSV